MQSVMTHQFSRVPSADIPRSTFDRSHGHKTTFDAGYLIPVYLDIAYPGDTFNMEMAALARLATPLKPIMDNMFLDSFFFAVPIRLVWSNWEKFNGAQDDPGDSTDFQIPTITAPGVGAGSGGVDGIATGELGDYFGIPTLVASVETISLFHRAYNLIWNTWFRDQNLQNSVVVDVDNGPDTYSDYVLLRRGKRHDYFTSALPWPQKDDVNEVLLPLGSEAPVLGIGKLNQTYQAGPFNVYETGGTAQTSYANLQVISDSADNLKHYIEEDPNNSGYPYVRADLSNATAATINALREAFQLQKLYERDARGGTRYTEIIKAHFGVDSADQRLQRPEYLGGGSTPIIITQVPQTSEDGATPQGNLAAYGTASFHNHGFTKSFTEHCLIIGLVSARADLTYQQGLNRMFSLSTRFDMYWPGLSHIGEQEVLNKEIYMDGSGNDDLVFGYQERYAELRYKPSIITGLMRSNATGSLETWHLSQEFGALPTLSDTFIQENPPVDRVIAVPTEPHFIFDSYFKLRCARPMPVYGVPGLIDHF